jgi:hypothetical protein
LAMKTSLLLNHLGTRKRYRNNQDSKIKDFKSSYGQPKECSVSPILDLKDFLQHKSSFLNLLAIQENYPDKA